MRVYSRTERDAAAPAPAMRERPASARPPMHTTRDAVDTAAQVVHTESAPLVWQNPTALDAPPPRPGYVQRWVRDLMTADTRDVNFAKRWREGWRPRDPATVPPGFAYLNGKSSMGQAVIRVGNAVLCELPVALAEQRASHYRTVLERQLRSAGSEEMAQAASAGKRANMRPIDTMVEDVVPGRRVPEPIVD